MFCDKNPEDWDIYLTSFNLAYNSAIQSGIKASPYLVVFGMEPRMPITAALQQPLEDLTVEQLVEIGGNVSTPDMVNEILQRFQKTMGNGE